MRALVYIHSRQERSTIRPMLTEMVDDLTMANSAEEVLKTLKGENPLDIIILDDSFDEPSEDGTSKNPGPCISEILQDIQTGNTSSSGAMIMVLVRQSATANAPGMKNIIPDSSSEDRQQLYSELGAYLFLKKPYSMVQLQSSLKDLIGSAKKPPKWLVALKELKKFNQKQEFQKALNFYEKLEEAGFELDRLELSLTRIKSLAGIGEKQLAAKELQKLEIEYPNSISIKINLQELMMDQNRSDDAFEIQLNILKIQKSLSNFNRTTDFLLKVCATEPDDFQYVLFRNCKKIMEILKEDALQYSTKTRDKLISFISENIKSPEDWLDLIEIITEETDILDRTISLLQQGLEKTKILVQQENERAIKLFYSAHFLVLKIMPDAPKSIEIAADFYLSEKDPASLDKILQAAEEAQADSIEYYVAAARYHLHNLDLKAASDILHKAVQVKADDQRVIDLRKQWKTAFDSKNA